MPLFKGKSEAAFSHNVKTEMEHGKSQPQSLAIAYSMKRKHKAYGGRCAHGGMVGECPHCTYAKDSTSENDPTKMARMAEGGMPELTHDGYQSSQVGDLTSPDLSDHERESGFVDHEGNRVKADMPAREEDERALNQHGEEEEGPQGTWMAEGGQITDNYSDEEDGNGTDMVGRIMKQRQRMYSKGGKVANQDSIEAGFKPNEFDDLHLRDDLSSEYTGANSGDELSNEGEEERRKDIVSRIMASRRKRPGHNPNPA